MTLEDLVPPYELCKQIPEGEFSDSALVWCEDEDGLELVMPREIAEFEKEGISAPTLQEIMDELSSYEPATVTQWRSGQTVITCQVRGDEIELSGHTQATAALKLWMEVNKPDRLDRADGKLCRSCHGMGYMKSHSDAPDQPCPHCGYTMPEDGEDD